MTHRQTRYLGRKTALPSFNHQKKTISQPEECTSFEKEKAYM
jgi:hypothetical protein